MKVIENVTLYQCDFCKKDYKTKQPAINHEPKCRKNPENDQKCLHSCSHLQREEVEVLIYEQEYTKELLFCNAKKEYVYPFWVDGWFQEDIGDGEIENNVMPKECNSYKMRL